MPTMMDLDLNFTMRRARALAGKNVRLVIVDEGESAYAAIEEGRGEPLASASGKTCDVAFNKLADALGVMVTNRLAALEPVAVKP